MATWSLARVATSVRSCGVRLIEFTLYSRSYCHLCEQMLADLHAMLAIEKISVAVVDVDEDPLLVDQYDELVPVLIGHGSDGTASRLCHYFLDRARVAAFCLSEKQQEAAPRGV